MVCSFVMTPGPSLTAAVGVLTVLWGPCLAADFNLTILHTNDVHARYEQFNKLGSSCSQLEDTNGECFGGYARLVAAVKSLRARYPNSLFLDGGDQYQGTLWFYQYGANITSTMMNWAKYDVTTLGNHEFDRKVSGLLPFLHDVRFNVVSSNIDNSNVPEMQGLFNKSVVKVVAGVKIGIVGYTTEDTPIISEPEKLIFNSVLESVTAEVQKLKQAGVKIIIALGHAGYSVDLEVAKIQDVDIVVGGHTDTFLYTGPPPSIEVPVDVYPKVVNRTDGNALVVQDFTWAKYLGILHVTFDDEGKIVRFSGNPQLQNSSIIPDNDTVALMQPYKLGLESLSKSVVSRTLVKLEGDRTVCRQRECNLGNVFADAYVYRNLRFPDQQQWNDVAIAVVNGGSVRASIQKGNITVGDVTSVMPFANTVDTGKLKGKHLRLAFEHSVERLNPCNQADLFGGFLQISGIKVVYDMRRPVGKRVVSLDILCTRCEIPKYEPLDPEKVYKVVLSSFVARGGDGYTDIQDNLIDHQIIEDLDSDVLTEYLRARSPVYQAVEGRISFLDNSNVCGASGAAGLCQLCLVTVLLWVFLVRLFSL